MENKATIKDAQGAQKAIAQAGLWGSIWLFTIWLFNIAMENGPFIDGLPIKNGDFPWLC